MKKLLSFFLVFILSVSPTIFASEEFCEYVEGEKYDVSGYENQQILDEEVFTFLATKDEKKVIVKKGIEMREYDEFFDMVSQPNGKGYALVLIIGEKWYIVKDEIESEAYDEVSDILYSPDGKSFSAQVRDGDKWFVIID
jgi:hypothetical protein